MRKILIAATAITIAGICSAQAADLAPAPIYTKAPVYAPVAAGFNWTGMYLGINGGWGNSHFGNFEDTGINADGGTVGGQIGYRWQTSNWVFGVEAQGNWADFSKSVGGPIIGTTLYNSEKLKTDAYGLFTAQFGVALDNVLLYAKGGGAVVSNKYNQNVTYVATGATYSATSASENRWGAVAGVGVDWAFTRNWTLGVEYNHIFMSADDNYGGFSHVDQDIDIATARLNYKF